MRSNLSLRARRQGGYLGLRSAAAGGRFLQARRRAPHRLCFFSPRLGVWEQFKARAQREG